MNYFVAAWGILLITVVIVGIALRAEMATPGSPLLGWLGVGLAGYLVYFAVQNIKQYHRARAISDYDD
ncbi:MAG: hypothetical protein L0241_14955 [Planctomycetia bacterium]|nr:hypothetical protein [Planctomycetia bacterium]